MLTSPIPWFILKETLKRRKNMTFDQANKKVEKVGYLLGLLDSINHIEKKRELALECECYDVAETLQDVIIDLRENYYHEKGVSNE
jgi:hypothetical protein